MTEKQKDIFVRAGKTFLQALFATAIAKLIEIAETGIIKFDLRTLITTVGIPALAAGLSAIQNTLFPPAIKPPDDVSDAQESEYISTE